MARPDIQYIRYYTEGSAARKLVQTIPEKAAPAPRSQKKKQPVLYIDPVAIIGMVTAVILVVCMFIGLHSYNKAQQRRYEMEQYVNRLEVQSAQLDQRYAEGYDLDDIRLKAVLAGYVPVNQVTHITVAPQTPAQVETQPGLLESVWISLTELFA